MPPRNYSGKPGDQPSRKDYRGTSPVASLLAQYDGWRGVNRVFQGADGNLFADKLTEEGFRVVASTSLVFGDDEVTSPVNMVRFGVPDATPVNIEALCAAADGEPDVDKALAELARRAKDL